MFLKVLFEVEDYQEIVRRTFSRVGHKLVSLFFFWMAIFCLVPKEIIPRYVRYICCKCVNPLDIFLPKKHRINVSESNANIV